MPDFPTSLASPAEKFNIENPKRGSYMLFGMSVLHTHTHGKTNSNKNKPTKLTSLWIWWRYKIFELCAIWIRIFRSFGAFPRHVATRLLPSRLWVSSTSCHSPWVWHPRNPDQPSEPGGGSILWKLSPLFCHCICLSIFTHFLRLISMFSFVCALCLHVLWYWTFLLYSVFLQILKLHLRVQMENWSQNCTLKIQLEPHFGQRVFHPKLPVSCHEFIPITRCNANVMFSVEFFFSQHFLHILKLPRR